MNVGVRPLMLTGFASFAFLLASSQTPSTPVPTASSQIGWLEAWRLATLSFGVVDHDSHGREFYKVIGSGVVFTLTPTTGYIVTAKHVFSDPAKNWHPAELRMRFGWQDKDSVYDSFGLSITLRDSAVNDLWKCLPDESDVAIIKSPPPMVENQPAVPLSVIATEDDFFEGANVIVLGYPGIVGNEYLVRAINRGGIVAWLNPKDAYGNPFLVDANIYPGNSGGPVIKVLGDSISRGR
jgi:S1-C subfamily serine protease